MKRQIPLIPISYWTTHEVKNTPLSEAVATFVQPHEHDWIFGHGGGNGIVCAIGDGRYMHAATRSERLAAFLVATSTHVSTEAASHWLAHALNSAQSSHVRYWLDTHEFPTSPKMTLHEYVRWREKADPELEFYEGLTDYKPAHENRE